MRTLFQTLDLADSLHVELTGSDIVLTTEGRPIPGEDNLVVKAAQAFLGASNIRCGAKLHLVKRIPIGAGLGGGSSNAATTLRALNELLGFPVDSQQLRDLAAGLGSDVGFFLHGGLAAGTGRGEQITPVDAPQIRADFLLVWPGFPIWTPEVYRRLRYPILTPAELTSPGVDTTIQRFREIVDSSSWGDLRNDLETVVLEHFPECRKIKDALLEAGCEGALLAGSGSTVFAVGKAEQLENAEERCHSLGFNETFLCKPVPALKRRVWPEAG